MYNQTTKKNVVVNKGLKRGDLERAAIEAARRQAEEKAKYAEAEQANPNTTHNKETCLIIKKNLDKIPEALEQGDLIAVKDALEIAQKSATNLKAEYDGISDLKYLSPEYFSKPLEDLQFKVNDFMKRRDAVASSIADEILTAAIKKFNTHYTIDDLYFPDRNLIVNHNLYPLIYRQWYKFDQRPFPISLRNELINLIHADIKVIGWIKWYEGWKENQGWKKISINCINGQESDNPSNIGLIKRLSNCMHEFNPPQPSPLIELPPFKTSSKKLSWTQQSVPPLTTAFSLLTSPSFQIRNQTHMIEQAENSQKPRPVNT